MLILNRDKINAALAGKVGEPVVVTWNVTVPGMRTSTGEGQFDWWARANAYGVLGGEEIVEVDGTPALPTKHFQTWDPRSRRLSGFQSEPFKTPWFSTFTVDHENYEVWIGETKQVDNTPRFALVSVGEENVRSLIIIINTDIALDLQFAPERGEKKLGITMAEIFRRCGSLQLT